MMQCVHTTCTASKMLLTVNKGNSKSGQFAVPDCHSKFGDKRIRQALLIAEQQAQCGRATVLKCKQNGLLVDLDLADTSLERALL